MIRKGPRGVRCKNLQTLLILGMLMSAGMIGFLMYTPNASAPVLEVDYIIIRDAPDGGGNPVGNRTYITGQNETYYAAGYNNTTGYVEDVEAYWYSEDYSVIDVTKWLANSTTAVAIEYGVTRVGIWGILNPAGGNITIEAFTGNLTVISDVDTIILRNESGGGGEWIEDYVAMSETYFRIYAAGYNNTRGYLRDVPVNWSSTNDSLCHVGTWRSNSMSVSTYGAGTCRITGVYSPTVTNSTGLITVITDIDYIVIRDSSNGGGALVEDVTYNIDQEDRYWAAGYNTTSGYKRDVPVYWYSSNDSVCSVASYKGTSTTLKFPTDGNCVITINYAWIAWNTTGNITVLFDIDYLVIRDAVGGTGQPIEDRNLLVDSLYDFYAAGYNNTDGFRRDLTVDWINSNTTVCHQKWVSGKGYRIEAWIPGACRLTATYRSRVTNETGNLTVLLDIDDLIIRDAPAGGGQPVEDRDLLVGSLYDFYAAGYNNTEGFKRDLSVEWINSNTTVCVRRYISGKGYRIEGWLPGVCRLTANYRSLLTNETGNLTVLLDIDYIVIRDSEGGGGNPVGDRTYYTGQSAQYYAAGYNNTTGYRRDIDPVWSGNNMTVCTVNSAGNVNFLAEGTCKISVSFKGLIENSTGNLTVEWDIDYLVVVDAQGGSGAPIGDRSYLLDSSDYFYAAGYNNSLGYRRDLKPTWNSSNYTVCSIWPQSNGAVHFTAKSVGQCKISATYLSRVSDSTGNITVFSDIDYIIVKDGPGGSGEWVDDGEYFLTTEHNFYAAGYNNSQGFMRDVSVTWTTNNWASCGLSSHQTYVTFKAKALGSCQVNANYYGILYNSTGLLHVIPRPIIIVDDDGTGDYLTIHEALEEAVDGTIIRVLDGTYYEHVVVNKSVLIESLDKSNTWVNGSGSGTVFLVTADDVQITGFTIESSEYGIFLDHVESASIYHNTLRLYEYGIYSSHSKYSHIEKNLVTEGSYGIVTYHSHNDAVWLNEISYNDVYGAKDYNSMLRKCFNWNYFHHNAVAYYYDPTIELSILEFDSNLLENNEIGVKVSDASTVKITNNTIIGGEYGIYIENASPWIYTNQIENNRIGLYTFNSSSTIENNSIVGSEYGIHGVESSLKIVRNAAVETSIHSIYIQSSSDVEISENVLKDIALENSIATIFNSTLSSLSLISSETTIINSKVLDFNLDANSKLTKKWFLKIMVEYANGDKAIDAKVRILDVDGNEVVSLQTGSDGWTGQVILTEYVYDSQGQDYHTPHTLIAVKDDARCEEIILVKESRNIILTIKVSMPSATGGFPWLFLIVIGSVTALGVGGLLATEVGKYTLLSLFVPLYMKLKKVNVLDHYNRGRVYQYIVFNPGDHFSLIRKSLGLNNGSLTYHLNVLEKAKKIKSRQDGIYKRFYPYEDTIPQNNGGLTEVQKRIVNSIQDLPGVSQKELASILGLNQSTVSYQLKNLESTGVIESVREKKKIHYYVKK